MIQEVDRNAVCVVRCHDWSDGGECLGYLAPGSTCHGPRIVDEENGVKGGEESVRIF